MLLRQRRRNNSTKYAPTCTEKGLSEGSHCSVCNEVITAQTEISALGHTDGEWVVEKEATCNTNGLRTKKCTVCGEEVASEDINALCRSAEKVSLSLSDYNIVYADSENKFLLSEINRFADILKDYTALSSDPVAESKGTSTAKEILIGLTSRQESKDALAAIHGQGYTIRAVNYKSRCHYLRAKQ